MDVVIKPKYLGLLLKGHLYHKVTARQSRNQPLGSCVVIPKCKAMGDMPYNVFSKLYNSVVLPVITDGAAIGGTTVYSFIARIQNRAC